MNAYIERRNDKINDISFQVKKLEKKEGRKERRGRRKEKWRKEMIKIKFTGNRKENKIENQQAKSLSLKKD